MVIEITKIIPKTHKVLELQDNGLHFTVIHHRDDQVNPYWLYNNWYDNGEHRRLVSKYADMKSCLCYIVQFV